MNIPEIKSAVKHLQKHCPCLRCNSTYRQKDITVYATTQVEGLFELKCPKCKSTSIVTVLLEKTPQSAQKIPQEQPQVMPKTSFATSNLPPTVTPNDILDIKNFLTTFDGNFKKIFDQ